MTTRLEAILSAFLVSFFQLIFCLPLAPRYHFYFWNTEDNTNRQRHHRGTLKCEIMCESGKDTFSVRFLFFVN